MSDTDPQARAIPPQRAAEKLLSEHALSWAGSREFGHWECGCGQTFDGHPEGTYAKGYAHPVHVAAALAAVNLLRDETPEWFDAQKGGA